MGRAVRRPRASCSTGEQVDVLHVCTPNDVHAEQALAAIERGMHVVCEKPLAVSTEESRTMLVAAAAERGLVARDLLPRARLPARRADAGRGAARASSGEITFVHGRYLCDDVLFPASGWRDRPGSLGPVVRRRRPRHALARSRRARDRAPGDRGAGRVPLVRRRPARGLRGAAAALRRRRRRARSSSRPGPPAARTSCCSSAREAMAGLTWDQEAPTVMLVPPGRRAHADRRQGPGRERRVGASAVPLPGRTRRGLRRRLPEPLRATSTAASQASRTSPSRRSPTATAVSRRVEAAVASARSGRLGRGARPGRLTPRLRGGR